MAKGIYRRKSMLGPRVCACGCRQTFMALPSDPKRFLNKSHAAYWRSKNRKGAFSFKHGLSKTVDYKRRQTRESLRRKNNTYANNPTLTPDKLVYAAGQRLLQPTQVSEQIVKARKEKTCYMCRKTYEVQGYREKTALTCSRSCATKLNNLKRWHPEEYTKLLDSHL